MQKRKRVSTVAGYRDRAVVLLVLLLLISGAVIVFKGPNWGIDITGGSRIMIRVEATEATVDLDNPSPDHVSDILDDMQEELNISRPKILENYIETGDLRIEIGKSVTEERIAPLIGEKDTIVNVEPGVTEETMDDLIEALRLRVDPYGTLGAQFKSIGEEYIRFQVALDLEEAESLLGEVGRLEIFVDDNLLVRGEHIRNVRSPDMRKERWGVPFTFTDEGARNFARGTRDKAGYAGVIYLDRPSDAVLLFDEDFYTDFQGYNFETYPGLYDGKYSENEHRFRLQQSEYDPIAQTSTPGEWFSIQAPALQIKEDEIPENVKNYLEVRKEELSHVIYLGSIEDLDNTLIADGNLTLNDNLTIPLETIQRKEEEGEVDWIMRAAGLESFPRIDNDVAGNEEVAKEGLRITTGDREGASEIRTLLAQRLPAEVEIESGERLNPRLGEGFIDEILRVGLIALLAVGIVIYSRYRRLKIAIPIMFTMFCEVTITLGFSSIIPETLMTIGIAEIGGLVAVIGFGVDYQIMITDEVLHGGVLRGEKHMPLERRTEKAYSIIFGAVATTIAAMVALATVGLGAMRGFAIVTIIGALISVLISRPAYAKIIGTLLEREQNKNSGGS